MGRKKFQSENQVVNATMKRKQMFNWTVDEVIVRWLSKNSEIWLL